MHFARGFAHIKPRDFYRAFGRNFQRRNTTQQSGFTRTIGADQCRDRSGFNGKVNAISPDVIAAFNAALDQAVSDRAVVIITGTPGILSGGYDLKVMTSGPKEAVALVKVLTRVQAALNQGQPVRALEFNDEEAALLKPLCLITAKRAMFVGNVAEDGFENNPLLDKLREYATAQGAPVVAICAKIEAEMADMNDEDKAMFLAEIGQTEPGLNRLIRAAFSLLGLQTYFTAGVKEVRAWTIHIGDTAPKAAGVIHTDFERGFIRAQTIAFDDFIAHKGEHGAKEAGKMRAEGKEYVVKDGDVLNFLFNV